MDEFVDRHGKSRRTRRPPGPQRAHQYRVASATPSEVAVPPAGLHKRASTESPGPRMGSLHTAASGGYHAGPALAITIAARGTSTARSTPPNSPRGPRGRGAGARGGR
jgi:hypothetical protein